MPTRRQSPESREFRQAAFASSSEFERGILGNLLAARCHRLTDQEEIAILWWLQQVSWRDGGLEQFAQEFLAANRARIGTPSMLKFGLAKGQIYSASQVRAVRAELENPEGFLLKGESEADSHDILGDGITTEKERQASRAHPECYPAAAFVDVCSISAQAFADSLRRALVDPASCSLRQGFWNFRTLWAALIEWRAQEVAAAGARLVETAITRQIRDELDFALDTRSFVLIEGREGIGKSEAARVWCDQHPGRAIYVRLEAGADQTTLFRSIARRIGTACSYQRKAVEMRARIQDALQGGHLALVIDEAHFLWPQGARSERGVPVRMDWLRTALVDFGVPVALVSTPQYFAKQCDRYRRAGWNANQVQRRLARTAQLPETLEKEDAVKVARAYFPSIPERLLKRTAGVALLSVARLTMFSHLRKRVDFLAARRAGKAEAELLDEALSEIGAPGAPSASGVTTPSLPAAPSVPAPLAMSLQTARRGTALREVTAQAPTNRNSASVPQFELSGV